MKNIHSPWECKLKGGFYFTKHAMDLTPTALEKEYQKNKNLSKDNIHSLILNCSVSVYQF